MRVRSEECNKNDQLPTTNSQKRSANFCWELEVGSWEFALQRRQRFLDGVVARLVPRILENFTMTDNAVAIDDEDRALGDAFHADHVRIEHAVLFDDFLVVVAQEREIQLELIAPCLEREERVGAHTQHVGVDLVQVRRGVAERAHLLMADTAERGGKKCENDRPLLQLGAERDILAILVVQREIGRLGAYVYGHRSLLHRSGRSGRSGRSNRSSRSSRSSRSN